MVRLSVLAVACLVLAGPASARPIDAAWPEVVRAEQGECSLSITGDGRFFRIAASGLGAGERARYVLENGDMRPIDWQVRADSNGEFARYYLPWRENHGDSQVTVSIDSASCRLTVGFPFRAYTG